MGPGGWAAMQWGWELRVVLRAWPVPMAGAPRACPFPCTALPTLWLTGLREEAKARKSWGRGIEEIWGGSRGWGLEVWGSGTDWGSLEEKLPPSLAGSWS